MSQGAKIVRAAALATMCVAGLAVWSGSQEKPKTAGQPAPGTPPGNGTGPVDSRATAQTPGQAELTADEAVFKRLLEPTEYSFQETPLEDALAAISKKHKLPIVI